MFLLRPSGKGVQKFEDPTGNWIDVHEAQKVMDAAMDEIAELRHLLNQSPADGFSAGDMADQGAKAFAARDPEVEQLRGQVARQNELLERMKPMFLRDDPCDLYDAVCSVLTGSKASE